MGVGTGAGADAGLHAGVNAETSVGVDGETDVGVDAGTGAGAAVGSAQRPSGFDHLAMLLQPILSFELSPHEARWPVGGG